MKFLLQHLTSRRYRSGTVALRYHWRGSGVLLMEPKIYRDEALSAFREARKLSYDFLAGLSRDQLTRTLPRPDLDTFGKHFQELGDTQESYALGIRNGTMDFSTIRTVFDYEMIRSADALREFLQTCDAHLERVVAAAPEDAEVLWPEDERISIPEQLSRLTRHEVFHHGQFAAYAYLHQIPFPQSWIDTWVLPERPGQLYPEARRSLAASLQ